MAHAAEEVEYAVDVGAVDSEKSGSIRSVSRFAIWMAYATAASTTSAMPVWFFFFLTISQLFPKLISFFSDLEIGLTFHIFLLLMDIDYLVNMLTLLTQSGFIGPRLVQDKTLNIMKGELKKLLELDAEENTRARKSSVEIKDKITLQLNSFSGLRDLEEQVQASSDEDREKTFAEYRLECAKIESVNLQLMSQYLSVEKTLAQRWSTLLTVVVDSSEDGERFHSVPAEGPIQIEHAPDAERREELCIDEDFGASVPYDSEAAVLAYFEETYAALAELDSSFHEALIELVLTFRHAVRPVDLGLDQAIFPFAFRKPPQPDIIRGPLKSKSRAWAKIVGWNEKAATIWPPLFAEVTDIIRATIVCSDSYELACFCAFMADTWQVVKIKNFFREVWDRETVPRVHLNIALWSGGRRFIVEVQLHLAATYYLGKINHFFYEIVRATSPDDVIGTPQWSDEHQQSVEKWLRDVGRIVDMKAEGNSGKLSTSQVG